MAGKINSGFTCDICGGEVASIELSDISDNSGISTQKFSIVRCEACGHHGTHPLPKPSELSSYYPETYYAHVGSGFSFKNKLKWTSKRLCYRREPVLEDSDHDEAQVRFSHLGSFLAEPPLCRGRRLLDIGCGMGEYIQFANSCGWFASGVEIDEKAVKLGQNAGLDILQGNAEHLPVDSNSFDVVRMWHVLEHAYSPTKVLSEIYRVLSPGGFLLLSVPNFASSQRQVLGNCWPHLDIPRHLHHFSPESLETILESNGLQKQESLYSGVPLFEIPWRLAVCRIQGIDRATAITQVSKSIIKEVTFRTFRKDQGSMLTWWVKKINGNSTEKQSD
ncbi:MAG: class I SAM-dependent methyltransferase [Thermoleophilia bacterium]